MRTNIIREKLDRDEPTLSTHIHTTWPSVVEALGHTGTSTTTWSSSPSTARSTSTTWTTCAAPPSSTSLGSMIKVDQSHQEFLAQRGIGAGFSSVLFTDARSAAEVRECVRIARADTPKWSGLYGAATRRNTYMGYGGGESYVDLINDTVVAVMIEKKGAVDDLDEILDIPGVDMVQWGGSDFSMSVGLAGQRSHPDIVAARDRVFKTALAKGVPPRAEVQTADDAKEFLDMGVRHFSIGTDITILYGWWQENGEAIWKTMEDAGAGRVE